jgi:hypothetical protein
MVVDDVMLVLIVLLLVLVFFLKALCLMVSPILWGFF